jgi:hypothetical protein
MGFRLITGTLGGGKSYYAAELAAKAWSQGAWVHSNMDWNYPLLERIGWDKKHVKLSENPKEWIDQIIAGAEGKENVLIVDESAMVFHAWDIAESKKRDRELFDVLVMSRKLGLDVYFISQHQDNVNSAIRRIAQETVKCVACKHIPVLGPLMVKWKGDFLRKRMTPEKNIELARSFHRFDKRIGQLYHTEAVRGAASKVKRDVTRKEENTPKTDRRIWVHLGFILAGLIIGVWYYCFRDKKPFVGANLPAQTQATKSGPVQTIANSYADHIKSDARKRQDAPRAPSLPPFAPPSSYKTRLIEWAPEDERIVVCVSHAKTIAVYTLGGDVWKPGHDVPGVGYIEELIDYRGEFFARTDEGRVFYLRRRTYHERREYDEWVSQQAANKQAEQKQKIEQQTPSL